MPLLPYVPSSHWSSIPRPEAHCLRYGRTAHGKRPNHIMCLRVYQRATQAVLDQHVYYHAMQCTRVLGGAMDRLSPDRSNRMLSHQTIATLDIRLRSSDTWGISMASVVVPRPVCAGSTECQ
jgi:hypothetical protein